MSTSPPLSRNQWQNSCNFSKKKKKLDELMCRKYIHLRGEELSYVIAHGRPEQDRQTDSDKMSMSLHFFLQSQNRGHRRF